MDKKVILIITACVLIVIGLALPSALAGKGKPACKDGIDNDNDGFTDWPSDSGCSSNSDRSELNSSIECDDGADNDKDGAIDSSDAGCSSLADNDETNCGDSVCEGVENQENCPEDCGYADSCSDTDPYPFDVETQGTVSGYSNSEAYSRTDYCDSSTVLVEYYCSGTQWQNLPFNCDLNYSSCVSGACT